MLPKMGTLLVTQQTTLFRYLLQVPHLTRQRCIYVTELSSSQAEGRRSTLSILFYLSVSSSHSKSTGFVYFTLVMSSSETPCHSVVFEDSTEYPSMQELRTGLEKGTDKVKIETLRRILVSTINGNPQVSLESNAITL